MRGVASRHDSPSGLKNAVLPEGVEGLAGPFQLSTVSHDDMVHERDADDFTGSNEAPGRFPIVRARGTVT